MDCGKLDCVLVMSKLIRHLDIRVKPSIIKDEERLNGCSSKKKIYLVIKGSQKQPSLCRVAVVFFAVILSRMGFFDDNRHRELPYMKSDSYTPSPPFGECRSKPPSLASLHPAPDGVSPMLSDTHLYVKIIPFMLISFLRQDPLLPDLPISTAPAS